jgi:hypothetical protein
VSSTVEESNFRFRVGATGTPTKKRPPGWLKPKLKQFSEYIGRSVCRVEDTNGKQANQDESITRTTTQDWTKSAFGCAQGLLQEVIPTASRYSFRYSGNAYEVLVFL